MLLLLDLQPFSRGTARQFANDEMYWVADEGFAIFNVPGGASAQEFLQYWKISFPVTSKYSGPLKVTCLKTECNR